MDLVVVLNEFASVFREIADKDYISARSNYRLRLREQFFWAGLQALEKYLKGILLFNEKKVREYRNHDLSLLSQAVQGIPWIDFQWPSSLDKTLERFRDLGENRYLSTDTYVRPENLAELDEGVWHIRLYCQYVRVTARRGSVDLTQHYVSGITLRPTIDVPENTNLFWAAHVWKKCWLPPKVIQPGGLSCGTIGSSVLAECGRQLLRTGRRRFPLTGDRGLLPPSRKRSKTTSISPRNGRICSSSNLNQVPAYSSVTDLV
jgi:HEPN domain-containing protein